LDELEFWFIRFFLLVAFKRHYFPWQLDISNLVLTVFIFALNFHVCISTKCIFVLFDEGFILLTISHCLARCLYFQTFCTKFIFLLYLAHCTVYQGYFHYLLCLLLILFVCLHCHVCLFTLSCDCLLCSSYLCGICVRGGWVRLNSSTAKNYVCTWVTAFTVREKTHIIVIITILLLLLLLLLL